MWYFRFDLSKRRNIRKTKIGLNLVRDDLNGMYSRPITRAEFCELVVSLYEGVKGEIISERKSFADTDNTGVEKAAGIGVVSGVSSDRFDPYGLLTREQAAVMLSRLAEVIGKPLTETGVPPTGGASLAGDSSAAGDSAAAGSSSFADASKISSWAYVQVGQMQAAGIMSGVGNNVFDPQGDYTREQSIITIIRLYDSLGLSISESAATSSPGAQAATEATSSPGTQAATEAVARIVEQATASAEARTILRRCELYLSFT